VKLQKVAPGARNVARRVDRRKSLRTWRLDAAIGGDEQNNVAPGCATSRGVQCGRERPTGYRSHAEMPMEFGIWNLEFGIWFGIRLSAFVISWLTAKKQKVANGNIWLHRDGASGLEQKAAKNAEAEECGIWFVIRRSAFVISPVWLLSLDACLLSSEIVCRRTISQGAA
jgi:hypothetical protein